MKIGAQMYTIREHLKTEQEIEASLRKLKGMGFDLVQASGLGPFDPDRLAGWLKELGMELCTTHSPWKRIGDNNELKVLIDEHKKLGCTHIGLGMKPDGFPNTYEGWKDFIAKVNEICKIVGDAGMTFGYHNHAFEFQKFNGARVIDMLIDECPKMDVILDLFWVQAGGANPCDYIEKLKGRIRLIHFKDFRMKGFDRQFAEIGQGNLNWNDIIPRCEKNGIPYAVIEQDGDFLTGDPFESLATSRKFLVDNGFWK
jgi:sugar phosphate isomerase/epimerase